MSSDLSVLYHSINPEANRSSYEEFNTCDFVLSTSRNIVRNSIRVEGKLRVNSTGQQRATYADRISMNKRVGIHGLLESSRVEVNGSIIENIKSDYARFVHMQQSATKSPDDYYHGSELCELKAPTTDASIAYCAGEADKTNVGQIFEDIDFSFKPFICLNRASDDIQMSRLGNEIRLSFNLARKEQLLGGIGVVAGTNYSISDLRVTFTSKPAAPVPQIQMRSVVDIKAVLNTTNANIQTRVPAPAVHAVSISFLKQSKENDRNLDTIALERPPQIDAVEFLFNDAVNQLQQFEQKDFGEYLSNYLASLGSAGIHNANPNLVKGNSVFGLGLDFNQEVDLRNQKFGFQIRSAITAGTEYIAYLFFHSLIAL